MADLGPDDGARLLDALGEAPGTGLRVNSRFGSVTALLTVLGWQASTVPWSPEGVLLHPDGAGDVAARLTQDVGRAGADDEPASRHPAGRHPLHDAGAYYVQDPSAMGVVPVLDPQPGERVLDLAAAPGGKSTYIADRMAGSGLLWSHDVDATRAGALVGNLERWGAQSVVVSHGPTSRLAPLHGTFDRVLLDAPCSGEGMFRKSRAARELWSPRRVTEFAEAQARLLDEAADLLAPGGVLVYSTCTFGPLENESAVGALLERRSDLSPFPFTAAGASGGLEPYATDAGLVGACARWWPHLQSGEGHFVARLLKEPDAQRPQRRDPKAAAHGSEPSRAESDAYAAFCEESLGSCPPRGRLVRFGEWLHLVPDAWLPEGIAPRRVGAPVGRVSGARFTPHHALSRLLPSHGEHAVTADLSLDDPRVDAYRAGAVIEADVPDGWLVVRVGGYPLGWAKAKSGVLNNQYPKGLRRT